MGLDLIGRDIGAYHIVSLLGAGGMGEVYRARDTKLGRDVAIKVLPAEFVADPKRRARFEREARLLAALNHPHIAAIYGLEDAAGVQTLVLELVEGQTLAERLTKGPLSTAEALTISRQIAVALEAAHDKGIVHRDLKPANIKIRPDGSVKVLDFGIAKLSPMAGSGTDASDQSPTVTADGTREGTVLGTAAYMSPEQARGKPVDSRSDIWAFGCVLYEMLTRRRAFDASDVPQTLARILERDPDWRALPDKTPSATRRLLQRCLEKDPMNRLRDIGDARLELDEALLRPTEPSVVAPGRSRERLAWALVTVFAMSLVAALALAAVLYMQQGQSDAFVTRFSAPFPEEWTWAPDIRTSVNLAVSRDGRHVAFVALGVNRQTGLWIRELGALTPRPLPGTEGASSPFWSPDNRALGFFADGKLKRIDLSGSPAVTLCDAPDNRGGSWGSDVIIFATLQGPLQRVPASGGSPILATALGPGEVSHLRPGFLPDGWRFFYRAVSPGEANSEAPVYLTALNSTNRTWLLNTAAANVVYSRAHLLFLRRNTLMAQPFDDRRFALTGEAAPIAENVRVSMTFPPSSGQFSASENGVLAYQTASAEYSQLVWYDRSGKRLSALGAPDSYGDIRISPGGNQTAVSVIDSVKNARDIWLYDLARGFRTKFTFDPGIEAAPIWSPDGSRIVFNSTRKGTLDLYHKPANSSDVEDSLLLEEPLNQIPEDWSPDSKFILYSTVTPSGRDLWVLPLFGDRRPFRFLQSPFNKVAARFSPNGRWIAYQSNESAGAQVYVAPFPGPGGRQQISADGGAFPRWRGDGTEIFYLDRAKRIVVARVNGRDAAFTVGDVRTLFQTRARDGVYSFEVSADGQRFLINTVVEHATAGSFAVVVNWPAGLRREMK